MAAAALRNGGLKQRWTFCFQLPPTSLEVIMSKLYFTNRKLKVRYAGQLCSSLSGAELKTVFSRFLKNTF